MTLKEQIGSRLKEAILSKDEALVNTLRSIRAKALEVEKAPGATELDDKGIIGVITTLAKQRRQSIEAFQTGGRQDLVDKEVSELTILESFLPRQLTIDEIRTHLESIIAQGSYTIKDMGKVMKDFNSQLGGQADGKTVSSLVKELLR